jgi:zinc transporter
MTFITGFFGMNTGPLPFGLDHPFGTWIASGIIFIVGPAAALSLKFGLVGPRRR